MKGPSSPKSIHSSMQSCCKGVAVVAVVSVPSQDIVLDDHVLLDDAGV